MTISANNAVDIKALLYALTQQREPLPQPFQSSLQEAGQALIQNRPEADFQLRERIKAYSPLDSAYRNALRELDKQYSSQERTKSLSATFASKPGLDWFFINNVIPATDWVSTAKQTLRTSPVESATDEFPDKVSRVAVMVIGGAAVGAAVAQLPGAIIGGLSAIAFGWWYVNQSA